MNEIVKEWVGNLLNEAIDEAKIAIGNERLWANGSLEDETAQTHLDNIELNEEYIRVLEKIKTDNGLD